MNLKNFKKRDRRTLSAAFAALMLSAGLLTFDGWIYNFFEKNGAANADKIGKITLLKNDVRYRHETDLTWAPAYNNKKKDVYQGDSIFTGRDSSAVIETTSGEKLSITPNSLVIISEKHDSITLKIFSGSVEAVVSSNKKLLISSNDHVTEISGKGAAVKIDVGIGKKIVLNVLSKEAHVVARDGVKVLRRDDLAEILADGSIDDDVKPNIELIAPSTEKKFKIREDQPVVFNWSSNKKLLRTKIKIGTDSEFKSLVVDSRIDDTIFSAYNLPRDVTLYWQIIAEGGASAVQKFSMVGDKPPIPVSPKPGHQFYFDPTSAPDGTGSSVDLSWEPGSLATKHEVQIADDMGFLTNRQVFKSKFAATLSLGFLPRGEYYWRVRAIDFEGQNWSSPSNFKIGPLPTKFLAAPITQLAENNFFITTKTHGKSSEQISDLKTSEIKKYIEKYPRLRWSSVAKAEHYILQIAKSRKFNSPLVEKKLSDTFYVFKSIEPSQYYWRVKAVSEDYKDGFFTQAQELKISLTPPQTLSQTQINDEVQDIYLLKSTPPPLTLKWNATVFTKFYELEFSESSNFSKPTQFITSDDRKLVKISRPGVFYWRVRSLDKKHVPISQFSNTYTLEYQRVYVDPSKSQNLLAVQPKALDSVIMVGNKNNELAFRWTKPYKHAKYFLQISYDDKFDSVFFSAETKRNYFLYTGDINKKTVYWRVRAEGADFDSGWTIANKFFVTKINAPFSFEQSDLIFAARLSAKDRQHELLAAQKRRVLQLRSPAAMPELQLEVPQFIDPPSNYSLETNIPPDIKLDELRKQPFEKFFSQLRNYPIIRWQKVPAAERYVIEIARDREFTQTVTKSPTWESYFTWDTIRPGRFYYRVQAFNDRDPHSFFSSKQQIDVTVNPPSTTNADTFVEIFDEPQDMWSLPNPFKLSWRPVVFARGYEVEFSENKTFDVVKVFKTKDLSSDIRVSRAGFYYWRVRPLSEHKVGIGPFSDYRSVEVIQTRRQPASVTTLTGLFPIDRTMLFVGRGLMRLPFQWISPSEKSNYELELSTTADFNSVLVSLPSKKNKTVVTKDLPVGKIYWRVRSGATLSAINSFILRREREPYVKQVDASIQK
ncbi:MAG: hypothetical protein A2Z20_01305 [Bdellovibrionales bacterium RBG_16_40_8]|nr:MAG: hypothetical protein A2Z20_01305 [Bdellovibrionales bacterium RBG_16_40_8]